MTRTVPPKTLPANPDIVQLRRQAKELLRSADDGSITKLADAQRQVAQRHGFDSWPKLRAAVAAAATATPGPRAARPVFATKERTPAALFTAERFLEGARGAGWEPGPLPDAIIFTFHPVYGKLLEADPRFTRNERLAPGYSTMFETVSSEPRVAVTCLSPGTTAMIGQVEHQVALGGASDFMILGTAGAIRPEVATGSALIVESAVRDDGVSAHYLPPDTHVDAHSDVIDRLTRASGRLAAPVSVGTTWTLPTAYRSTAAEVEQLAAEGVSVVECEVASLLAVAEALDVRAGALLAVTSTLVDQQAAPAVRPDDPAELLEVVLDAMAVNS